MTNDTTIRKGGKAVVATLVASLLLAPAAARAQAQVAPMPPPPPPVGNPAAPPGDVPPPPSPDTPPMPAMPPPPPAAVAPAPAMAPPAMPSPVVEPPMRLPAYLMWGAAGASLIVGASFGIAAISAKNQFNDAPSNDKADKVYDRGVIADVGLGLGAILAVTGAVFYFSGDHPEAGAGQASKSGGGARAVAAVRVAPFITPSGAGGGVLSMRF